MLKRQIEVILFGEKMTNKIKRVLKVLPLLLVFGIITSTIVIPIIHWIISNENWFNIPHEIIYNK